VTLGEMLLPTASVFVKRLLGFRGQVLGGAVSLLEVHDYHEGGLNGKV
jgi:hypothetical protein